MNIKDPGQTIEIKKTHQTMTIALLIETMLKVSDELKDAYYLKEAYREFNLTATYENAEEQLDVLCDAFKTSGIKEYNKFRYLLLEWKTEILNSFFRLNGYRISNGNLERKNSDIKTIIKVSNGYTNFERLRNRIENTNIAFSFLDKEFAISELQQIYEIILDKKLVSANFRKKIEPMIKKTDKVVKESAYRPSYQYTFNEEFIRNWV